jgi:hypothetical protein
MINEKKKQPPSIMARMTGIELWNALSNVGTDSQLDALVEMAIEAGLQVRCQTCGWVDDVEEPQGPCSNLKFCPPPAMAS